MTSSRKAAAPLRSVLRRGRWTASASSAAGDSGGRRGTPTSRPYDYQRHARRGFLMPLTLVLGVVTIAPFLYALWLSLTNSSPLQHRTSFIGVKNYETLLSSSSFWQAALTTVIFTAVAVAVELALAIGVGYALHRLKRGSSALRTLFILPMAAAPIAVMYDWQLIFNALSGVANFLLGKVGLPQPDWLGSAHMALPSLMIIDIWEWTPFILVIIVGGLSSIPEEIYEAAQVDGASALQQMWRITVPLLRPYIMVACLFRVIDALKTFDSIQVLTSGGPGTATTTLNYYSFQQAINNLQFGTGTATALILLVIALVLTKFLLARLERSRGQAVAR